ncbi:MAG: hypothetical protein KA764_00230 [Anaerolineales bacterium]|nr:hypothetical protein [Anaerolineales bacterium]
MEANLASTHVQTLKRIGRNLLHANQLAEAVGALAAVLRQDPSDVETHLWLGDIYLAGDDSATAQQLYRQAQALGADPREIQKRLGLLQADAGRRTTTGEPDPTDPAALERLLQRLTGASAVVSDQDIHQAAQVLQDILGSRSPAETIARRLPELEALLPSLLELNIREADKNGRPNLAEALRGLQGTVRPAASKPPAPAAPARPRLLVWDPAGDEARWPVAAWRAAGYPVEFVAWLEPPPAGDPPIIVARHPHTAPERLGVLQAQVAAGAKLILVLETDVAGLTPNHSDYERLGLSTPERQAAYTATVRLATLICVPNAALAELLRPAGCPVRVIPPSWNQADEVWHRPATSRTTLNIGWIGASGETADLADIRRQLLGVLREFPATRLVVVGDASAYQLFHVLPEERRQYLPSLSDADDLETLRHLDVLVWPLRNTLYNRTRSDAYLLAAGVRRVPWLASPAAAALGWSAGGLIAAAPDDWRVLLRRLVQEPALRRQLEAGGRALAETRELTRLGPDWLAAVASVAGQPRPAGQPQRAVNAPSRSINFGLGQRLAIPGVAGA